MDSGFKIAEDEPSNSQQQQVDPHSHHQPRQRQQLQLLRPTPPYYQHHHQQQQQSTHQQIKALLLRKTRLVEASQQHTSSGVMSPVRCADSSAGLKELVQLLSDDSSTNMSTSPSPLAINTNVSSDSYNVKTVKKCRGVVQEQKAESRSSSQSVDAVQQSHVSSSKPSFVLNDLLGSLLLKALNGFLFVVNSQGKVEYISENVTQFLRYTQDDLIGKGINKFIHGRDLKLFTNNLLPMTLTSSSAATRGYNFHCRMLVKPPDDDDVVIKQTIKPQFENMQITAFFQSAEKLTDLQISSQQSKEDQTTLLCIVRHLPVSGTSNMKAGDSAQFTTKQNLHGKIIQAETSPGIPGLEGGYLTDFCHVDDIQQVKRHSQEVLKSGQNTSGVYRFRLAENHYSFVQTKSKLFRNQVSRQPEFIVSTHTIIRECEPNVDQEASMSSEKLMAGQTVPANCDNVSSDMLPLLNLSSTDLEIGSGLRLMDQSSTELDILFDLDFLGDSLDVKLVTPDGSSVPGLNNWGSVSSNKSHISAVSTHHFASQNGPHGHSWSSERPLSMNMRQTNSSSEMSQKSPRFSPSPGSNPCGSKFNQVSSSEKTYPCDHTTGGNRSHGQLGFQENSPAPQVMSPRLGFSSATSGWPHSPASTTATPSGGDGLSQFVGTPTSGTNLSLHPTLQSLDFLTEMSDRNVNNLISSAGLPSSFLSFPPPSYPKGMDLNSPLQQNIPTVDKSSSSSSGLSSHTLSQLLNEKNTSHSIHSQTSSHRQGQIVKRGQRSSGQLGTRVAMPNPMSSCNTGPPSSAGSTADVNWLSSPSSTIKSPEDVLPQSPTQGPGQSPQSTFTEDEDMDVTDLTGIDSSSNIRSHKIITSHNNIRSHVQTVASNTHVNASSNSNSLGSINLSNNNNNNNYKSRSRGRLTNNGNCILKSLLDQNDDDDDKPSLLSHGQSFSLMSSLNSASEAPVLGEEKEKDQANILLKQLLGEQAEQSRERELNERIRSEVGSTAKTCAPYHESGTSSGSMSSTITSGGSTSSTITSSSSTSSTITSSSSTSSTITSSVTTNASAAATIGKKRKLSTGRELLQQLLDESDDDDDNNGGWDRITTIPSESPMTEPEKDTVSQSRHLSASEEPQSTSTLISLCPPPDPTVLKQTSSKKEDMDQLPYNEFLCSLWSKDDSSPKHQASTTSRSSIKRQRTSVPDADSSDGMSMDTKPSISTGMLNTRRSKLLQKNALLAQLLSKNAQKQPFSGKNSPISPTSIPQNRYSSKNLIDKIINIKAVKVSSARTSDGADTAETGLTSIPEKQYDRSTEVSSFISNKVNMSSNNFVTPDFLTGGFSNSQSENHDSDIHGIGKVSTDRELSQFQKLLDGKNAMFFCTSPVVESAAKLGYTDCMDNDPLLQQILQEAAELQDDLLKNVNSSGMAQTLIGLKTSSVDMITSEMQGASISGAGGDVSRSMSNVSSFSQTLNLVIHTPGSDRLDPMLEEKQHQHQLQQQHQQHHQKHKYNQQKERILHQHQQKSLDKDSFLQHQQQQSLQQQQLFQLLLPSPQQSSSNTSVQQSSCIVASSLSTSSSQHTSQQHHKLTSDAVTDESSLIAQLEEIFKETGNWPNLDNFRSQLSLSNQNQSSEQLVIDGIKRQLMDEDPVMTSQHQQHEKPKEQIVEKNASHKPRRQSLQQKQQQQQKEVLDQTSASLVHDKRGTELQRGLQSAFSPDVVGSQTQQQIQQLQPQQQPQSQQQSQLQQQPRLTVSQGPVAAGEKSETLQPHPICANTSFMTIRQTLLYQQQHQLLDKQKRGSEKHQPQLQQQSHLQQQQQAQFQPLIQSFSHRSGQTGLPIREGSVGSRLTFPENLRELLTQGHPPNVTLISQDGQFSLNSNLVQSLPVSSTQNPASHMLQQRQQNQHQQHQQQNQHQQHQQQNQHQQHQQQNQFSFKDSVLGNPTSSLKSSAGNIDQSFLPPSSQQLHQPQGQQGDQRIFQQVRMLQAAPAGQGTYFVMTPPSNPLLILSQNVTSLKSSSTEPQQSSHKVATSFTQDSISSSFGAQDVGISEEILSFPGGASVSSDSTKQSTENSLREFNLQLLDVALSSVNKKNISKQALAADLAPSASVIMKQELRNFCSARSVDRHQLQPQPQQQSTECESSCASLPLDILETIDDMTREREDQLETSQNEADAVYHNGPEGSWKCKQLQKLSTLGQQMLSDSDPSEQLKFKATSFCGGHILRQFPNIPPAVSKLPVVIQSSSVDSEVLQTLADDIQGGKTDSLLCQLLLE